MTKIRFIKIDAAGFDRRVAATLRTLLVANRPYIKSEIYKPEIYQHLPAEERLGYYDDLRELDYRILEFNRDEDYAGTELKRGDLTQWKHFDILSISS